MRLNHLYWLTDLRRRLGVRHPRPADWLRLVCNALAVAGRDMTDRDVREYVCRHDGITQDMIEAAIRAASRSDALIAEGKAGRLADLTTEELFLMQEEYGLVLVMHPADESDTERKERRATRRRQKAANRKRRQRAKPNIAGGVTLQRVDIEDRGRDAQTATSQRDRIVGAIEAGADTAKEIAEATGLPEETVRPWLSRLKKAGAISSPARGRYELAGKPIADQAPGAAAPAEAAVVTSHSEGADVGNPDTAAPIMPANLLQALYLLMLTGPAKIRMPCAHGRVQAQGRLVGKDACTGHLPRFSSHLHRAAEQGARHHHQPSQEEHTWKTTRSA